MFIIFNLFGAFNTLDLFIADYLLSAALLIKIYNQTKFIQILQHTTISDQLFFISTNLVLVSKYKF